MDRNSERWVAQLLSETDAAALQKVAERLVATGPVAIPALVDALVRSRDGSRFSRNIVVVVRKIGAAQAAQHIIDRLDGKAEAQCGSDIDYIKALKEIGGAQAAGVLLARFVFHEWDGVRGQARQAIEDIGEQALAPLVSLLSGDSLERKRVAIELLGKIGDRRAVKHIWPFLTHPQMQSDTVTALGRIGDPRALKALHHLYRAATDLVSKKRLAVSLARLGWADETSLGYVQEWTQGGWPNEDAALGLLCVRNPRAIETANAILSSGTHSLRAVTAKAAGKIGSKDHWPGLVNALLDAIPETRASAWESLTQLEWTPSSSRERAIAAVYSGDAQRAAAEGAEAVEALAAALWFVGAQYDVNSVAVASARLLAKFPSPETEISLLKFAIHDPLPDKRILEPAMESLMTMAQDTSLAHLLDCWQKNTYAGRISMRIGYVARRIMARNAELMSDEVLQRATSCPNLPHNGELYEDQEINDGRVFPCEPAKAELERRAQRRGNLR